jgi:hypothetical protein
MLSAEKDANRATRTTPQPISPNGATVGKVVNSIQSLRQRLDDYTLDEVADAENRSRILLLGLSNLQLRVGSLAAIKQSMTALRDAIAQARSEDFTFSTCEVSDKPLRLHDIVKASNLIKFPSLKKLPSQTSKHTVHNASVTSQISSLANDKPKLMGEVIEARPAADRQETIGPEEPPFVFDTEQIGTALSSSAENFSWGEEPGGTFCKDITDEVNYNQDIGTNVARPTAESIKSRDFLSAPEHDQLTAPAGEPMASTSTALVPSGGDFDQRLLDDLIKNYGEFFGSADSRAKVEPQAKIETGLSSAKILLETPAVESLKDKTARALPLKKEGDINRQLKKIIKDYGEYDIYSRQSPINLKFALIGAFLLLGAVFSGFYLLSSSKSQETSSLPASAQPALTIPNNDTAENSESKRLTETSGAKALNKPIPEKK